MIKKIKIFFILLFFLGSIGIIGCIEESPEELETDAEGDVEFENIEFEILKKGEYSNYVEINPEIFVVNNRQEWDNIKLDTIEYSEFNISDINFENELLIVALLGQKSSSGYIFDIIEIRKREKNLEIFTYVKEPEGGIDVNTSPYIFVKVNKEDIKGEDIKGVIKFVLFFNEEKAFEKDNEIINILEKL